jgi:hypothetical protein
VQSTVHVPAHVTWQVELPAQDTVPPEPTVAVQVEFPVQLRLHPSRQVPEQLV